MLASSAPLSQTDEVTMNTESFEEYQEPMAGMVASANPAPPSGVPSSLAAVDYERGLAYAFGEGVTKDLKTAFEYFKSAAEKNHAPAQYKLGVAYAYAEGVDMDKSQAIYWYQKAAFQGHTIAQRNLGVMYENGEGVIQDKAMALAWFSILADSGNIMDIRRKDALANELSSAEVEAADEIKKDLLANINSNRM